MILTKHEFDDPEHLWKDIVGKSDKCPVYGDIFIINFWYTNLMIMIIDTSYERLLALFVGSYFVNTFDKVMPRVTDTDLFKTRDQLGEYYLKKHDYF